MLKHNNKTSTLLLSTSYNYVKKNNILHNALSLCQPTNVRTNTNNKLIIMHSSSNSNNSSDSNTNINTKRYSLSIKDNQIIKQESTKNPLSYTTNTNITTSLPWNYTVQDRMTKYGSKMSNRRIFLNTYPILSSVLYYIQCCDIGIKPTSAFDEKLKGAISPVVRRNDCDGDGILSKPPFLSTGDLCKVSNDNDKTYKVTQIPMKTYTIKNPNDEDEKDHDDNTIISTNNIPNNNNNEQIPEILIAGRFKVGKSDVLNAILQNHTPKQKLENKKIPFQRPKHVIKKTRNNNKKSSQLEKDIKMYELTNRLTLIENNTSVTTNVSLRLIDVPGYDFEHKSFIGDKELKWKENIRYYVMNRGVHLKRILLLVDCRYGLRKTDADFFMCIQECFKLINNDGNDCYKDDDIAKSTNNENQIIKEKNEIIQNLPPIQIMLTKCNTSKQIDLSKRIIEVTKQINEILGYDNFNSGAILKFLPVLLVDDTRAKHNNDNGIADMQCELSTIVDGF